MTVLTRRSDRTNPLCLRKRGLPNDLFAENSHRPVLAESIRDQLVRLNSEFAHYVPAERQLPDVVLLPAGDPGYFPVGVKHRYTRGSKS